MGTKTYAEMDAKFTSELNKKRLRQTNQSVLSELLIARNALNLRNEAGEPATPKQTLEVLDKILERYL